MTFKNAKKSVGLSAWGILVTGALLCGAPANAEPKHDETLAKKIATHVAEKLGGLRAGFDPSERPAFVEIEDIKSRRIADTLEQDGLELIKPVSHLPNQVPKARLIYAGYEPSGVRIVYNGIIIQN